MTALHSCRDDDGDIPSPRVFISKPFENQPVQAMDTLIVEARITHDTGIQQVELELVDGEYNGMGLRRIFAVSGTDVTVALPLDLDAPLAQSGIHHIAVRAFDGQKRGSSYRRVHFSAVPRLLERVWVATRSPFGVQIWSRGSDGEWVQRFTRSDDSRAVALNYRQNVIGISGGEIGDLVFYSTSDFAPLNSLQGLGEPSLTWFFDLSYDRELEEFMVLLREPRMRVYDKLGMAVNGFPLKDGYLPSRAFAANDQYYVGESPISQPNQLLTVYARPGLRMATLELGGPPIGVFAFNDHEVFLWENDPEGAKLRLINTNGQLIADIFQRAGEELLDVVEIATGNFAFLTDQGLYRYNFGSGATIIVQSGIQAEGLAFDEVSQFFYLRSGSVLKRLSMDGQFISEHHFPSDLFWIGMDYNR